MTMNNSFKPRMLLVHNYYQVPGGEDTVVANEKKLLEDNGHSVILYSRNNMEMKEFTKFQKLFIPFTTVFSFRTYREIRKILREKKIDIVHVHNTLSLISPSVYYAAFRCKIPVIQTIHNFRLLCPGALLNRDGHICEDCLNDGLICALKHKCYRGSLIQTLGCVLTLKVNRFFGTYRKLNFICLTEFNKLKLTELNRGRKVVIDLKKISIKSNFVNLNREIIPFKDRKNQFIYVGRLDSLKGINMLLEAWKLVKDLGSCNKSLKLIICGSGQNDIWCKKYIADNKLDGVSMKGYIQNDKVLDMIAESKALILPTQLYEGFPMNIVEAMACGTPVIGSDLGNTGSLIQEGITGIKFDYNSAEALKSAMCRISDMCQSSKDYYDGHYTTESNYTKLLEIYRKAK